MGDYDYLNGFRAPDGSTTSAGQHNAGVFERQQGWTPAPKQPGEGDTAFQQRITGGNNWSSNGGNG